MSTKQLVRWLLIHSHVRVSRNRGPRLGLSLGATVGGTFGSPSATKTKGGTIWRSPIWVKVRFLLAFVSNPPNFLGGQLPFQSGPAVEIPQKQGHRLQYVLCIAKSQVFQGTYSFLKGNATQHKTAPRNMSLTTGPPKVFFQERAASGIEPMLGQLWVKLRKWVCPFSRLSTPDYVNTRSVTCAERTRVSHLIEGVRVL